MTALLLHEPGWQRVAALAGAVLLFLGFGAILYAEFSPSTAFAGLVDHGLLGAGFLCMALSFSLFCALLIRSAWRTWAESGTPPKETFQAIARECGLIMLNILCYGGSVLVALGALSALDRSPAVALVAIVLCIAVFVLYFRHRKRHKVHYRFMGPFGLILFLAAIGLMGFGAGGVFATEAAADAATGPRTVVCMLSDADVQRPSGRYAAFRATSIELEFAVAEDDKLYLSVKQQDWDTVKRALGSSAIGSVTYYPRTRIFVDFQPLQENRSTADVSGAA